MTNFDIDLAYEAYTDKLYELYISGEPEMSEEDEERNNIWGEEDAR